MSNEIDDTPTQYASTAGTPPRERSDLLVADRCRAALDALSGRTMPISLEALANRVTERTPEGDAAPADPEAVKIRLHHLYLPKLEAAGLAEYDRDSGLVHPKDALTDADEPRAGEHATARDPAAFTDELRERVAAYFAVAQGESASLDDLSRYAATELADDTDRSAQTIRLRLHHAVLPKLDHAGLLDYDSRTSTVRWRSDSS